MRLSARICAVGLIGVSFVMAGLAKKKRVPLANVSFVVIRDENSKPVRNAAVVMHPVNDDGKQRRQGLELKSDADGKASFDGVPYGKLRIQVLAQGFQTYGEDFEINKPTMEFTIKLKRPQGQFSVYDDRAKESNPPPKQDAPPPDPEKKPN